MDCTTPAALQGIRVLDAATMIAAPTSGAYLADFGADVIKIEHPETGDPVRSFGKRKHGVPLYWKTLNRNKRCITLDLGKATGQALFKKLAAEVDVVVENYRPGTIEKWGLGYETLREVNPSLILLRTSGYGQTGPNAYKAGFGTVAEGFSGFTSVNGHPDGPPTLPGFPLADTVSGLAGALCVLIALHARNNLGGKGQVIDLALYEPLVRLMEMHYVNYDQLGFIARRVGNNSAAASPRNAYRTLDEKWVALSASTQNIAVNVFTAIGKPELVQDERFRDNAARLKNNAEVDSLVGGWIAAHPLEEVLRVFAECKAVIGPMYDVRQAFEDPHFEVRGTFASVEDEELGTVRMPNVVARFSATPGKVKWAGPAKGSSNADVYGKLLGLSETEMETLRGDGVI